MYDGSVNQQSGFIQINRWIFSPQAPTYRLRLQLIRRRHDALIKEMLAAEDLPTLAFDKADAFDYHFMAHLMGKLQASTDQAVRACV